MTGLPRPDHLATTDWLAEHLGRPEVRILDARWRPDGSAAQTFAAGHIPGATLVDWRTELMDAGEDPDALRMGSPAQIAAMTARAGIGDASTVVIYDDTLGLYAARIWWTLRAYGLGAVRVLDGGLPAWIGEGRTVARSFTIATESAGGTGRGDGASGATEARPTAGLTIRAPDRMHLTTADVRGLLGAPDVTLLDARAPAEYRGFEGTTRRLGHIPGAVNVPVGAMHRPGSQHLRDGDELRARLHAANVTRGRRMVTYDGSGVAAAKLAFILTVLGHEDVAVYDGGWAEWGNRLDLPVDR